MRWLLASALLLSACGDDDAGVEGDAGTDASLDAGAPDVGPRPVFHAGPYGAMPRDVAGPFVAPTLDGDFDFEAAFDGETNFVFVVYAAGQEYTEQLFASPLDFLLEDTPANTHFVFGGIRADSLAAIGTLRDDFEALFVARPDLASWRERLHFVSEPLSTLEGALGDHVRAVPAPAFGIDRFQRWRNVGLLLWPLSSGSPAQLHFLASEVRYWEFEHARQVRLDALDADHGVRELEVFSAAIADGSVTGQVTLPSAEEWAGYDTLEVDLTNSCIDHLQDNCWEWDRIGTFRLCHREGTEDVCDIELARMITSYHREGRWVTDETHVLALLAEHAGSEITVRWDGGPVPEGHPYVVDLSLRLSNRGKPDRPYMARAVFTGGRFDEAYNAMQEPVMFEMPAEAMRVELVTNITGHGFGAEADNCAEFCPHSHHFFVGSMEWTQENPVAGTTRGCFEQVDAGVVPNQFGTWPLGRGGWCPGLDVTPFVADLTPAIDRGGTNTLRYEALLGDGPYTPNVLEPDGFRAQLEVSAWLVFYR